MIALALILAASPFDEVKPKLDAADVQKVEKMSEHTRKLLDSALDSMILSGPKHLHELLELNLDPQGMEIVLQDNCVLCHSDPTNQKPKNLINAKEFVSDVHFRRGLSCAGCHGGKPTDDMMSKEIATRWPASEVRAKDKTWIPQFCAKCHADPVFMRGFNPTLPTDQFAKYQDSQHGKLILSQHDSRAAQCVSCHGVHGIRNAKSRKSKVHPANIPETCGACHADPKHMAGFTTADGKPFPTNQLELYKSSVHGKALLVKGDLGAPACTGCHGSHAAMPPAVASVAQVCRRCHARNGSLFDGSRHKKAFEEHKWPECGQCHGEHGIQKPTDTMIGATPGTLCQDCHAKYSANNPTCSTTAAAFRKELDALSSGREHVAGEVEHIAERGLDSEPLANAVGELDEALVQTRAKVHAFDYSTFEAAAKPGDQALEKASKLVDEAHAEHGFRKRGLLLAIGFMGLIAIGIALKLREIDKR